MIRRPPSSTRPDTLFPSTTLFRSLLSAGFALAALGYFWYLRIVDNPTVAPARQTPPMPWNNIRRYLSQPRLRLAWIIPFGRSTFWTTFFVYPPLYIVERSEEHTSELQSLMRISYAVFCLKKKKTPT